MMLYGYAAFELHRPADSQTRARRVVVLLLGILILSAADLAVTITHLKTTGMDEINPIAAAVIQWTHSIWGLAAFKLATVSVCLALLFRFRHQVASELAAWIGLGVLAALACYWGYYAQQTSTALGLASLGNGSTTDRWLTLVE